MSGLDIGITVALAFLLGLAAQTVAFIGTGRITVVVLRHNLLRPRGPDGRFLRDRDIAVGAALEAASRQTGSFGR
jgi:hypothetical protein